MPDWDAVLNLGFPGLLKRCEQYRKNREENGLLDKKTAAFFDGMILSYQAILALIDLCIPRGGKKLINFVRDTAKVPTSKRIISRLTPKKSKG